MTGYAQTNLALYREMLDAGREPSELAAIARGYELSMRLFSGLHRASGKPFVAHLVGTASVLASVGSEIPLVLAGLLHAAYVQGRFGDGVEGATARRRALLNREIGAAEPLVYRYTSLPWRAGDLSSDRNRIESLDELDRQVTILRLANEIEEAVDGGILYHSDGETRRTEYLRAAPVWIAWARALSQDALAGALEQAADGISRCRTAGLLRSARDRSFRPAAIERPTVAGRTRRAVGWLRRKAARIRRSHSGSKPGLREP